MSVLKVICPICGQEISKSNFSKHERRHKNHPESFEKPKYSVNHEGLTCQFCGKECKNKSGLFNHEAQCNKNPNRLYFHDSTPIQNFNNKGRPAWNKGLTKENDERIRKRGEKLHNRYKNGELIGNFTGKKHSEKTKAILREKAIKNGLGGHPYRNYIEYKGVILDSNLELMFAKKLDELGILWERPGKFDYFDDSGIYHTYTPDFYLSEYDVYFDPKNEFLINNINPALGFKDCDKIKWVSEQNNIKVFILREEDVKNFNIKMYADID